MQENHGKFDLSLSIKDIKSKDYSSDLAGFNKAYFHNIQKGK